MEYSNIPVLVRFIHSDTFSRRGVVKSIIEDIGIEFLEDDRTDELTMLIPWTAIAFVQLLPISKEEQEEIDDCPF